LAKLKKLTGGGYITARGLQDKLQTTWLQTHLPIMTTNELPKAKADDAAFWARAVLVKWPLSFVDDPKEPYERKADKDLDEKLKGEAQGVLARMVRGAMEYLRDGLIIPDRVKQWTSEQRASWDDVGLFITDWCVMEPHEDNPDDYRTRISATDLHEAFSAWYATNRDKRFSISAKKFAEMLNKKDIPSKRSNGTWRLGITLNADGQDALNKAHGE
jgi:putative DNA primase/helicase